jgi:DNA-binding Xre family transcriptional regulator
MTRKKRGTLKPANSSIVLYLAPIIAARQIHEPYAYLLKLGIVGASAAKMLHGKSVQINFKQLTALCTGLHCTPNDLFATRQMTLDEQHPLQVLAKVE